VAALESVQNWASSRDLELTSQAGRAVFAPIGLQGLRFVLVE